MLKTVILSGYFIHYLIYKAGFLFAKIGLRKLGVRGTIGTAAAFLIVGLVAWAWRKHRRNRR